jgi:DNA-binding NtrC family response regulator
MQTSTAQKTILVVDDEAIIRDFLKEVLEDFHVTVVGDGDEAIAAMSKSQFDLVITDLRMPKVSGEEVVRDAKARYPQMPVIVISGYSSLYTVSQSVSNGACAVLSKPFSIKELLQTVNNALSGAAA